MRLPARGLGLSPTSLAIASLVALLLLGLTTTAVAGASTMAPKCDYVRLRTGPGTTYGIVTNLMTSARVTVVATVSGSSYSTTCGTATVKGSTWYRISAVNGTSTASTYGRTYVYGAAGLFKAVAASPTASPHPTASPAPSGGPSAPPGSPPSAAPSAAPSAPPDQPSPPAGKLVQLTDATEFFGRGYGHGVGMSQYGAEGRALAGQTAATILGHYYVGTTLGTVTNAQIRVLLMAGFVPTSPVPLRLYGRVTTWTIDGVAQTFPVDSQLIVTPDATSATGWHVTVKDTDNTVLFSRPMASSFRMRPGAGGVIQVYSKPTSYDRFRGVVRVITTSSGGLNVVNEVPLESYLQGVVPAEMSPSWPTEALRAQAIAARSYATYQMHPTTGTWDVYDDSRSQVYRGYLGEQAASNMAVTATAGKVVLYGGKVADTMFHSSDGGWTEDEQNVYPNAQGVVTGSPVPYLTGEPDRAPDGSSYDHLSPWATWHTSTYSLAQMQDIFGSDSRTNVGQLVAIDLRDRGVSGRLISVTLIGADGSTKTVSGGIFITVFNANTPASDQAMMNTLFDVVPIP